MDNLAESRRVRGELQAAHNRHEHTLAARRQALGDDHPDTLISTSNLAAVCHELGEQ